MKILLILWVAVTLVQARTVSEVQKYLEWLNEPVLLPPEPTGPADDRKTDSGPMTPGSVGPESGGAVAGSSAAPVGWKDNGRGEGSAAPPDDRKTGPLMASGSVVPRPRDTVASIPGGADPVTSGDNSWPYRGTVAGPPVAMEPTATTAQRSEGVVVAMGGETGPVESEDGSWAYAGHAGIQGPPVARAPTGGPAARWGGDAMPPAPTASPRSGSGVISMNLGTGPVGSEDNSRAYDGSKIAGPPVAMEPTATTAPRSEGAVVPLGGETGPVVSEVGSWAYVGDAGIQGPPVARAPTVTATPRWGGDTTAPAPTASPRSRSGVISMNPGTGPVGSEDNSRANDGSKVAGPPVAMEPTVTALPRSGGGVVRMDPGTDPVGSEDGSWACGGKVAGPPEKSRVLASTPVPEGRNAAEKEAILILEDVQIGVKMKKAKLALGSGPGSFTIAEMVGPV
ncbi:GlyPro1 [Hyposoter didymator ichnovirus]|nr:glycine and proline-rich protein P45 precursor [Hyposoter didymator ichnovirus]AIK25732.1 GlyPro1 [Hyposoter didymator ichnovirus]